MIQLKVVTNKFRGLAGLILKITDFKYSHHRRCSGFKIKN